MMVALNIIAAVLLTVLPVVKPCDCRGFRFVCACAFASKPEKRAADSVAVADQGCCCCKKSAKSVAKKDAGDAPDLPAPKKHRDCMKHVVAEVGNGSLVAPALAEIELPALAPVLLLAATTPIVTLTRLAHAERPPPLGLVLMGIRNIRI